MLAWNLPSLPQKSCHVAQPANFPEPFEITTPAIGHDRDVTLYWNWLNRQIGFGRQIDVSRLQMGSFRKRPPELALVGATTDSVALTLLAGGPGS
jgi:hypothetical protein